MACDRTSPRPAPVYATLEAFVRDQAAFMGPHRVRRSHRSNAYGFHDEGLAEPKPPGRLRSPAVGDSFTFGVVVPCPMGVMALTEAALRRACAPRDLDLLKQAVPAVPPAPGARGGQLVDASAPPDGDPATLVGPILTPRAYDRALAADLGRVHRPADSAVVAPAWAPTLAELDALRTAAAAAGAPVALALLPSELQVGDTLSAEAVARLTRSGRYRGLRAGDPDPRLPDGVLETCARSRALPCAELTDAFAAARRRRPEASLCETRGSRWTPGGNRLAAGVLTPFLAGLACRERGPR